MELKDQTVFMNPYMNNEAASAEVLPPALEKLDRHGEPQKPVDLQADDDIMDLLKYCEDKLDS